MTVEAQKTVWEGIHPYITYLPLRQPRYHSLKNIPERNKLVRSTII